jgi:SAM-dependent methyltransferase
MFMHPRDIALFLRSARTDAAISRARRTRGARAAFEAAYAAQPDPWASGDARYRYQANKYAGLLACLPAGRRFPRALDVGSGIGALSRALAAVADDVLGLDIAQSAVERARALTAGRPGLRFAQADATDLPHSLNGQFDLVVVADTIYYLDRTDDMSLKAIATRMAELVAPGGLCLIANHFFFAADPDSRLSRRIHNAFTWSPHFRVVSQHRRAFYLATLLAIPEARPAAS